MSFEKWFARFVLDVHMAGEFLMLVLITAFLIGLIASPGVMLLWAIIHLLK